MVLASMSLNDLAIARSIPLRPLAEVARIMGLGPDDLEPYGNTKAKVKLDLLKQPSSRKPAKYVVVTAITPTPLGEGKTVHTVGISQALNRIGKRACCVIRQPSMGPVFGIKGGAAGGGYRWADRPDHAGARLRPARGRNIAAVAHDVCCYWPESRGRRRRRPAT